MTGRKLKPEKTAIPKNGIAAPVISVLNVNEHSGMIRVYSAIAFINDKTGNNTNTNQTLTPNIKSI